MIKLDPLDEDNEPDDDEDEPVSTFNCVVQSFYVSNLVLMEMCCLH